MSSPVITEDRAFGQIHPSRNFQLLAFVSQRSSCPQHPNAIALPRSSGRGKRSLRPLLDQTWMLCSVSHLVRRDHETSHSWYPTTPEDLTHLLSHLSRQRRRGRRDGEGRKAGPFSRAGEDRQPHYRGRRSRGCQTGFGGASKRLNYRSLPLICLW